MKRFTMLAGATLFLSAPLAAQQDMPPPAQDYAAMSDAEIHAALQKVTNDTPPCTEVLPLMQEGSKRWPSIEQFLTGTAIGEIMCFSSLERYEEAYASLKYAESRGTSYGDIFNLWLATATENGDTAMGALRRALLSDNPDTYNALSIDLYWQVWRTLHFGGMDQDLQTLAVEVYRKGLLGKLQPRMQSAVASDALRGAIAQRQPQLAEPLLKALTHPLAYDEFLTLREYQDIWPYVEQRAGPHRAVIIAEYKQSKQAEFDNDPNDPENLSNLAQAMAYARDHDGVIRLIDGSMARTDFWDTTKEDEAWALSQKITALDALGRQDEASALFDRLANVDADKNGWMVNFLINRGLRLMDIGAWQAALDASDVAGISAKEHGNDYAQLLVVTMRVCSLSHLGRTEEAAEALEAASDVSDKYPSVVTGAHICVGDEARAVELAIKGLEDATTRAQTVSDLQPKQANLVYTKSQLRETRDLIPDHPKLRDAFLKYARFMPEEFYVERSVRPEP